MSTHLWYPRGQCWGQYFSHSTFHQSHPSPINMESHNNNMLTILSSTSQCQTWITCWRFSVSKLCLLAMHAWFRSNDRALNPDNTDTIVFGSHRRSQSAAVMTSVNVARVLVKPSDNITLLGATLDNKLTLTVHVSAICKATFFHIQALRHIRSVWTEDMAKAGLCQLNSVCSVGHENPQTATYAKHHCPGCQAFEKQYGCDGHT